MTTVGSVAGTARAEPRTNSRSEGMSSRSPKTADTNTATNTRIEDSARLSRRSFVDIGPVMAVGVAELAIGTVTIWTPR